MNTKQTNFFLMGGALLAIAVSGWLYAQRNYQAPSPPPQAVWSLNGPVIVHDDEVMPGDLISSPDLGTVYYLNDQKERVVFPDEQTFFSWYENYDSLIMLSREKLESYPLSGRNATIRPGTLLVTIVSSPNVWMVSHPKNLHWLAGGEEQALALFGENWKARLVDLPEYYFVNYVESWEIDNTTTYPVGLMVHVLSNDQYYLIDDNSQRLVTPEGMKANHLNPEYAIERDEPLEFADFGPPLNHYEPRWGSPDLLEQRMDAGPSDLDVQGQQPEVG